MLAQVGAHSAPGSLFVVAFEMRRCLPVEVPMQPCVLCATNSDKSLMYLLNTALLSTEHCSDTHVELTTHGRCFLTRSQHDDVTSDEQCYRKVDKLPIAKRPLETDTCRAWAVQTDVVGWIPFVSFAQT